MTAGNDKKDQELRELWREMQKREDALVEEYKKNHKLPSRGVIDTPELRELREEKRTRFIQICEKYKR